MIIPTLHIDGDEICIHLVDPIYPHEPYSVIEMGNNSDDTADMFLDLLTAMLENYDDGYDVGYNDAMEDMEGGEFNVEI